MRKWIWAIAAIVILIVAGFYFMNRYNSDSSAINSGTSEQQFDETHATDLQTADDDFNEIENSLDSLG